MCCFCGACRWKLELRTVFILNLNTVKASKSKWGLFWIKFHMMIQVGRGRELYVFLLSSNESGTTWRMSSLAKYIFLWWELRLRIWSLRSGVASQRDQGLAHMLRQRPYQNLSWWMVLLSEVHNFKLFLSFITNNMHDCT
jgi:hypothetical protein